MSKTPRTEIVAVRFTPEERQLVESLAERMGGASLSDCIRAATKMYATLRLNPRYLKKYWIPFYHDLVDAREITAMDLTSEEQVASPTRRH